MRKAGSTRVRRADAPAARARQVGRRRNLILQLLPLVCIAASPGTVRPSASGALYSGPADGSQGWREPREVVACNGAVSIYNTAQPRYELFLPQVRRASGAAVLMLPGGGLRMLGVGPPSDAVVRAFLDHGVAVLRLEYRTLQVPSQSIPHACARPQSGAAPLRFPKLEIRQGNANPAPDNRELQNVLKLAVQDARAALSLLHRNAGQWHLEPRRIGVIGESAGGGVAFGTVLASGPVSEKPAFLISIFGPALQDVAAPENAPPLFLATEADHGPVTDGLLALFSIWKNAGFNAELHVYEVPPFSMKPSLWSPRLFDWMRDRGFLTGVTR